MPENEKISNVLKNIPLDPGVYIMKDDAGNVIYIGKAASLKKRVSSYFQKRETDPKTAVLKKNIADLEYIVTDSEIEALILESTLIKKHKPKFNVRLKDDKRYPYIAVTLNEKYPRVIYTRKIFGNQNRYYGPYTDAKAAKNSVALINNIFKLKTCRRDLPLKKGERPCLNHQIKKCMGACTGEISENEYRGYISNVLSFLDGNIDPMIENLQKSMNEASSNMDYEKAARVRDIIFDIQKISESQKVSVPSGFDKDYAAVAITGNEAVVVLFEFRKGVLMGRKISIFQNAEYSTPGEIIRSFIIEHYDKGEIPQQIIVQHKIDEADVLEQYLTEKSSRKTVIATPHSSDDSGIINMIIRNIDVISAERNASRILKDSEEAAESLRVALGMKYPPETIACFDISNFHGKESVASMVFFRDGSPEKGSYRRFKIRGYDSPNDPGMIHEAVSRRLQSILNDSLDMPDLIVIDGGTTQLSRAMEAASAIGADVKIISLAKKFEEIYTSKDTEPLRLDRRSPALRLLQSIRDEAHRFAITYHRKLRDLNTVKSELDSIPEIGEKTKILLLNSFKSIERIKNALPEEIETVAGIGKKTASAIFSYFHDKKSS